MTPGILVQVAAILTFLGVGLFVLTRDPRRPLYRSFAVMSLAFLLHAVGMLTRAAAATLPEALIGTLVLQFGLALIPVSIVDFTARFIAFDHAALSFFRSVGRGALAVMTAASLCDYFAATQLVAVVEPTPSGFLPVRHGPVGLAYTVVVAVSFLYSVGLSAIRYSRSTGRQRAQLQFYLMGFGVAVAGCLVAVYLMRPFSAMASLLFWYVCIAYAITRYQFLDIQVVVRLGTVYASVGAILLAMYAGLVAACTTVFGRYVAADSLVFPLIAIATVALCFDPLRGRVQALFDRAFFRQQFDIRAALEGFSSAATRVARESDLHALVTRTLVPTLVPQSFRMYVRSDPATPDGRVSYRAVAPPDAGEIPAALDADDPLVGGCRAAPRPLLREQLRWMLERRTDPAGEPGDARKVLARLDALGVDLALPLGGREELLGLVTLGPKRAGIPYRAGEIAFASSVAAQAAVALQNIRLHAASRRLEQELHQADKLASLGALVSEIAHEVRNPLSVVKTYFRLIPEKFEDPAFRERLLQRVTPEIDRVDGILSDLLRGVSGRRVPRVEVRLTDVADATLDFLSEDFARHRVAPERDWNGQVPALVGDPGQLRQVFHNLVLNAVQAMPGGGRLRVRIRAEGDVLRVEVSDTGIGIPADRIPALFRPFASTKPGGAGLGLAISRRIVQEHDGTIQVESRPGEGATFVLEFPLSRNP